MAKAVSASTKVPVTGPESSVSPETEREAGLVDVSIVMPCLNEEESVATCVTKARRWLERAGLSGEVIVVDNGSEDASVRHATQAGAKVVHEPRRGYGSALLRGIVESRSRYVVMGDCDDTYDYTDLDPFIEALEGGADIVVGNRYAGGIVPGAMTWSHRHIGTPVITFLLRLFSGARLGDSQCGLRAFTRVAFERLELHTPGMEFASEMILKAARKGLRVVEVPIAYYPRVGEAKLRTFRDGWRHLRFLLLMSPHFLYTVPGILLALTGSLILTLGLASSEGIVIGPVVWQPVFAGSILMILGINALIFSGIANLYTTSLGLTQPDLIHALACRLLRFEVVIVGAAALIAIGIGLDIFLLVEDVSAAAVPNRLGLAAVAQAIILSAGNFGLAGFLASLLNGAK
ncbi:MAG: glycosyltransferase family 2 protein [Dehalococcoidia bacterium]